MSPAAPHPYHLLKAALSLFEKGAETLSGEERSRANAVALRCAQIESAVLSSNEATGVCLAPSALDKALAEISGRFEDHDAFHASLDRAGIDETMLHEALRRDLLVDAVLERVGARAGQVGTTEAEIFYYAHINRFRVPEKRTARHILITLNEDFADNRREQAEQRIREIARRLGHKPERFAEQAGKHSECPTALHGGLIGDVERGQLYPELDAALFELRSGQLSGVLQSELGFHLVRCDAIHPERTLPFDEVAASLRQRLTEERARGATKQWLTGLLAERQVQTT